VSPRPRAALVLAALAVTALVLPAPVVVAAALVLIVMTAVDALAVREPPSVERRAPTILARGVPAPLALIVEDGDAVRVRQPLPPDLALDRQEGDGGLETMLVGRRRGRHPLPAPAVRVNGPLGLASWYHRSGEEAEVLVYPDLPGARRLASAVRQGHFRQEGRTRGPLGLGTEFESVRSYLPDDDVRHINWRATQRLGRPMSNQYRVERDRDVICVVDCGRLMAAPIGDRTRLDAALDAAVAVAAVADELGDRCGAIAFDADVRRWVAPRRRGSQALVAALFDAEPRSVDSDYERAFAVLGEAKRAFALVLTDLLDEAAARPLVEAVPVLRRRHLVAVASAADADLDTTLTREPARPLDVYRAAVALDVVKARQAAVARLRHAGAEVIEAAANSLPAACVRAYLSAKARALV
jgi:uncharacterized protein (DUF58 family)